MLLIIHQVIDGENAFLKFPKELFQIEEVDHWDSYERRSRGDLSFLVAVAPWEFLVAQAHVLNFNNPVFLVLVVDVYNTVISTVSACGVNSIECQK